MLEEDASDGSDQFENRGIWIKEPARTDPENETETVSKKARVDEDPTGNEKGKEVIDEEAESARLIEYRFLKIGLLKGESCIYTTHEDNIDVIEREMAQFGIDVDKYKKKKQLHVYKITDPQNDPDGLLKGIDRLSQRVIAESKPPFRVVARFIKNYEKEFDRQANMFDERYTHSSFDEFQGSFICPYLIKDILRTLEGAWMQELLRNHHIAIFVFKDGHGLALNLL